MSRGCEGKRTKRERNLILILDSKKSRTMEVMNCIWWHWHHCFFFFWYLLIYSLCCLLIVDDTVNSVYEVTHRYTLFTEDWVTRKTPTGTSTRTRGVTERTTPSTLLTPRVFGSSTRTVISREGEWRGFPTVSPTRATIPPQTGGDRKVGVEGAVWWPVQSDRTL